MKISLNWLKKFVEIPENVSAQELAQLFTIRTAEVEGVVNEGEIFNNIVVGKIISITPHPNATKLRVTQVDIGREVIQIVCGGPNIVEGMYVIVALPGSRVKWHGEGDYITLEKAELRGLESNGMICGGEEVGLEETPEGVLDLSTYHATSDYELKPGTQLGFLLEKNDVILEIDNKSLTHRPDLWGHYGIAREMAAIFDTKCKSYEKAVPVAKIPELHEGPSIINVKIQNTEICPRFTACVIKNIMVKESPEWLKKDLIKVGIRPVNNIVDVTNYVMCELGQPMHAYDQIMAEANTLEVRYAKKGEFIETIDHKHHDLSEEDPVITNGKDVLTIAGVMGGAYSEINNNTTSIILESANWQPGIVRKASQRNGLRTDAVQRFEKSLDPEITITALLRAIALIKKICPRSEVEGNIIDEYPTKFPTKIVTIRPEKIQQKIGDAIATTEMKDILKRLGFEIASGPNKTLSVTVPTWRATKDVATEDDIVEEIARIHGYEKIPSPLPSLPTTLPEENITRLLEHASRNIFSNLLGCDEMYNYSFYSHAELANARLPEELHLRPENYLSTDQTHLRISLVPNLLKNIQSNLRFKKGFKIYEIGHTYLEDQTFFPKEDIWLAGAIIGSENIAFLDAKGMVDTYMNAIGAPVQEWKSSASPLVTAHPHIHTMLLSVTDSVLAHCYELHPVVATKYDLPQKIAIFEINLSQLAKEKLTGKKYQPIPRHPGIEFDIAILIDKKTPSITLKKAIESALPELIQSAVLFDQYEGEKVATDKKSLAYRILLQSDERTLTDEDLTKAQKVVTESITALGGEIR